MKNKLLSIVKKISIYQWINVIFFCIINILLNPEYETNDDQAMAYIAMGVYGQRDYHLIFINVIIGKILVWLFTLFPWINWYVVLYEVLIAVAVAMLISIFENRYKNRKAVFPIMLITYFFAIDYYYYVQFSKIAGMLIVVGLLYSVYLTECGVRKWNSYILPGLFILLGTFYRFQCIYIIGFLFIPVLLYTFIKAEKKQKVYFFIYGTLVCTLVFGLKMADTAIYQADEEWAYYLEFNSRRGALADYGWPDYDKNVETFDELGISKADYNNFVEWDFADSDIFTLELMDCLLGMGEKNDTGNIWEKFWLQLMPGLLRYNFAGIVFMSVAYLVIYGEKKEKYLGLFTILAFLCAQYILVYRGRFLARRIDVSMALAVVVICIYLASLNKASEEAQQRNMAFVIATCIFIVYSNSGMLDQIGEEKDAEKIRIEMNELIREDESIYMIASMSGEMLVANIWDAFKKGEYDNIFRLGGWLTESPIFNESMEKRGIDNLYRELASREDIYCIDNTSYEYKLPYIRENYNEDVQMILDKYICEQRIWRFVTGQKNIDWTQYIDGTAILEHNITAEYSEDGVKIEGVIYEPDTNSYEQNVYVVVTSETTGERSVYYTTQMMYEESVDKMNGRYSAFCTIETLPCSENEHIYVLLENENGYYYVECYK